MPPAVTLLAYHPDEGTFVANVAKEVAQVCRTGVLLTPHRVRRLGFIPASLDVPDPAAQGWVLGCLRQVLRCERPLDPWTAQLATIVHHTGLGARWLHEKTERQAR